MAQLSLLCFSIFSLLISAIESTTTFTFVNKCDHTVWPGILTNAGVTPLPTTGFVLETGGSRAVTAPASWAGRFWGRSNCSTDPAGKFSCLTGDCASGKVECSGNGAIPPATLAEFTLDGSGGMDFFDVSLVDGYNLPLLVSPRGGSGRNCNKTGCAADLNESCPEELKASGGGACRSACEAFRRPEYCCSGEYGSPDTCRPTRYSEAFKSACPTAYSYAYDDRTSTFTCTGADYTIIFCPAPNASKKSTEAQQNSEDANGSAAIYGGMVYEGALDQSESSSSVLRSNGVAAAIGLSLMLWQR